MATTFKLRCTSSGNSTEILLIDNLVFQDTWAAATPEDWDVPGGDAKSLGQPQTFLTNGTGTPHILNDFRTSLEVGASSTGTKNSLEGAFPPGDFDWEIIQKS